ncbi:hypothetical protein Cch01nite_09870 [Cellulomonas chitinilytica]|uniref:Alpha/beta hydrolase n=1 Tax=Cellulomonas chitinilytica TaxID=398759 RepID=A0A919P1Q8_9CELL|nr:alpha/beta hydrolase [Cellulomonas chitinilytica]GIG20263.1 hypothetical protein Cch01nite_09870 [Cellulomonas chitinilytica]
MPYANDGKLPVIYVRGYAGGASGINTAVNDPFYGFNEGAVQVRVDGENRPRFHQFESPLLRLMTDHGYDLLVKGNQELYLKGQPDGTVPAASIWVHRFYDEYASRITKDPNSFSIEDAADDLLTLVRLVLVKTGAPRVFLVAHSMGGLVVRSMLQRSAPDDEFLGHAPDAATGLVDRVFTYATPHGGIEFAHGFGLLEKLRDLTGFNGADIFGPERMREYLTPRSAPRAPADEPFDATRMPDDGFPIDRLFCLVGTNADDYAVGMGIPKRLVGERSDGLVQIDNAAVRGAARALVHRSHSGPFGIVNSEEGYQNLQRFLFGDLEVVANLTGVELPGTRGDDITWQLEVSMSIRTLPVVLHEQSAAHLCPVQIEWQNDADQTAKPVPLVRTFLSSAAARPTDATGAKVPTLRHVLGLRLVSLRDRNGLLSFFDHVENAPEWTDALVVDIGEVDGHRTTWATWNSAITTAIRDWEPRPGVDEPVRDVADERGHWKGVVPLPAVTRRMLGPDAAVTLEVFPRATLDLAAGRAVPAPA